ncbi:MAG: MmgE/PrpD family protein [Gemmatimonadetes bacterium]|nr:MmgE/PrpD family protein [Gemmatimonadota bacterium]
MTPRPASRLLADFCASARFRDLPTVVVDEAHRAILDWLGSAMSGALEPPAQMAREVVRQLGASRDATVFAGARSSAAGAALANGVASHILELDDVHKGSTLHAAAPVIPAALSVAEREHASGEDFLLAVALGYEAALRVGEAVNPSHYRYWHPTGTAATFGAAVAAGSLVRLSPAQMLDALGSAGTQASGLWEFNADGAMSKALHPGKAAMNGVLAADLARVGFTGATRILEGERGFFRATTTDFDASRVTEALGSHWKLPESCYKLHSCCGHTHTAIDVSLEHRAECGWRGDEALGALERVEVETYEQGHAIVKQHDPTTPYQAKFSLAYCVAAALVDGAVGLEQFAAERFGPAGVGHAAVAALLPRIEIRVVPDITARYPAEWGTRITYVHRDGTRRTRAAAFPRGNPENPVSTAALADKLRALVTPRYDAATAERAVTTVLALASVPDMSIPFAALAPARAAGEVVHP